MDLSFGIGQARRKARVELDYRRLIAIVASAQAASRTATVESQICQRGEAAPDQTEAMVRLIVSRSGWLAASRALGGSFNPAVVGNAP